MWVPLTLTCHIKKLSLSLSLSLSLLVLNISLPFYLLPLAISEWHVKWRSVRVGSSGGFAAKLFLFYLYSFYVA